VGEYSPGYIYGTVKTHKPNISQIPTPIHEVGKQLNRIITPYLPAKYQINSTDEFLQILKASKPTGMMASLDAESLFTNVPLMRTIDIICEAVYSHPTELPPSIDQPVMKKLLAACTTGSPFVAPSGTMYTQVDGVSMGSSLGVTFANFYMCHIENTVLACSNLKPSLYCRYVDDCYVIVRDEDHLRQLKDAFEEASVLKFTYETAVRKKIHFLDVEVDGNGNSYVTSTYRKPTSTGTYLNPDSECPDRYVTGTV